MSSETSNSTSTLPILFSSIENENIQNIQKTDDDGFLQIYSYKHCDNTTKYAWDYRGLVLNGERKLFRSLGYTPEYNDQEKDNVEKDFNFKDFKFFRSEEGTLLRMFYFEEQGKWYLTTHRKLDAFKSRWGSASSFGDIFLDSLSDLDYMRDTPRDDLLSKLTEKMDKNFVYFFLVRNTSNNRIVAKPPSSPTVFQIGAMDVTTGDFFHEKIIQEVGIHTQTQVQLENWDDVFTFVKNIDPFDCQGLIGFNNGSTLKIINSKYQLYSQVRGNESSLLYRYLHIRSNPSYLKMINEIYPEHVGTFVMYENTIFKIAKSIHTSYINRFVNKQHVVVPQDEYRIVSECHGWHISNRQTNKVSLSVVLATLSQERFASTLFQIIKRYMTASSS